MSSLDTMAWILVAVAVIIALLLVAWFTRWVSGRRQEQGVSNVDAPTAGGLRDGDDIGPDIGTDLGSQPTASDPHDQTVDGSQVTRRAR